LILCIIQELNNLANLVLTTMAKRCHDLFDQTQNQIKSFLQKQHDFQSAASKDAPVTPPTPSYTSLMQTNTTVNKLVFRIISLIPDDEEGQLSHQLSLPPTLNVPQPSNPSLSRKQKEPTPANGKEQCPPAKTNALVPSAKHG
jgi:hypothetical protein